MSKILNTKKELIVYFKSFVDLAHINSSLGILHNAHYGLRGCKTKQDWDDMVEDQRAFAIKSISESVEDKKLIDLLELIRSRFKNLNIKKYVYDDLNSQVNYKFLTD